MNFTYFTIGLFTIGLFSGIIIGIIIMSLCFISKATNKKKTSIGLSYIVGPPILKRKEVIAVELNITNEQKVKVTVNPVTLAGNPATLDGPIKVDVQSGDGTVEMIDDKSFYLISGNAPGDTAYTVSGDADIGVGVENVADVIVLHVAGARAAHLGMIADVPELK